MADYFEKEVIDSYKSHSFHKPSRDDCSLCYKERKIIQSKGKCKCGRKLFMKLSIEQGECLKCRGVITSSGDGEPCKCSSCRGEKYD